MQIKFKLNCLEILKKIVRHNYHNYCSEWKLLMIGNLKQQIFYSFVAVVFLGVLITVDWYRSNLQDIISQADSESFVIWKTNARKAVITRHNRDTGSLLFSSSSHKLGSHHLLCVVFTASGEEVWKRVKLSRTKTCDWLILDFGLSSNGEKGIVRYRGNALLNAVPRNWVQNIQMYCEILLGNFSKLGAAADNLCTGLPNNGEGDSRAYNEKIYPKVLMFLQVLQYAKEYRYVWLLDDDLDVQGLDIDRYFSTLQCAFGTVPLASQPVIYESTQTYKYLRYDTWSKPELRGAVAAETGFIEVQAPILESGFFVWFTLSFVWPMALPMHYLGADWGFDAMFCRAARHYIDHVLRQGSDDAAPLLACGIATDQYIHHSNRRSMNARLGSSALKRAVNLEMMRIINESFPGFMVDGHDRSVDPTFHSHMRKTC